MTSKDIVRDLIENITSGELKIDYRMPSEAQLSIKYGCNRHTIRKVLETLIERGYLRKVHGGPTYVNPLPHNHTLSLSSLSDVHSESTILSSILQFKCIKATNEIAMNLALDKDSKVWYIIRLRSVSNIPDHIEEIYMPYSLFPTLTKKDCESSLLTYIENQLDFEISHGIKNIKPIKLNKDSSSLLMLPEDSLALQVENTGYLTNGRIYEFSINKHRENTFTYYAKR